MKNCCMTHCPVSGVYLRRFIPAALVAFAFVFVFDFLFHGNFLMPVYQETPQLWRTPADMQSYFTFMLGAQFLLAWIVGLIFTRNYEGKGLIEGVRYGAMIGFLLGVCMASSYAWMPISLYLAAMWFTGGFVQGLGLGLIYAAIYRDPCCKKGGTCDTKKE
jgi:hypothetical protein